MSRKTLCPPRTMALSAQSERACSGLCAISAPSMTVLCRVRTMFLRPLSGLPPEKSASVRRPTITVLPRVKLNKMLPVGLQDDRLCSVHSLFPSRNKRQLLHPCYFLSDSDGDLGLEFGIFIALYLEAVARKLIKIVHRGVNNKLRRSLGRICDDLLYRGTCLS